MTPLLAHYEPELGVRKSGAEPNRLIPVRAGGVWVNTNLSNGNSENYNKVLLLNNAISFEVEFALSEKMVTHLKGAEARYVRSNQAPKERCKMILPKE
jgi:hypothetical protein